MLSPSDTSGIKALIELLNYNRMGSVRFVSFSFSRNWMFGVSFRGSLRFGSFRKDDRFVSFRFALI